MFCFVLFFHFPFSSTVGERYYESQMVPIFEVYLNTAGPCTSPKTSLRPSFVFVCLLLMLVVVFPVCPVSSTAFCDLRSWSIISCAIPVRGV